MYYTYYVLYNTYYLYYSSVYYSPTSNRYFMFTDHTLLPVYKKGRSSPRQLTSARGHEQRRAHVRLRDQGRRAILLCLFLLFHTCLHEHSHAHTLPHMRVYSCAYDRVRMYMAYRIIRPKGPAVLCIIRIIIRIIVLYVLCIMQPCCNLYNWASQPAKRPHERQEVVRHAGLCLAWRRG